MARKRSWERFGDRRDETTPAALSLCWLDVVEFVPDGDQIGDPATVDEENRDVVPDSPSLTKLKRVRHFASFWQIDIVVSFVNANRRQNGGNHVNPHRDGCCVILAWISQVIYLVAIASFKLLLLSDWHACCILTGQLKPRPTGLVGTKQVLCLRSKRCF